MSSIIKPIRKFLLEPESIDDIDQVRRLLAYFGYIEKKKRGGECVFHKKGSYPINVPTLKGRKVKSIYIRRLAAVLKLEEWYEKNKQTK